jgi:pimeloyl-ACP methyl ester carboxylesterase
MTETLYLNRPGGRIAYDDSGGDGHVVIAAPGMGDLRGVYRHIAPTLVESGLRFVSTDLRGQGESSVGWDDLSDDAIASDLLALIDVLGVQSAVLVGSSLSCASAVIAATDAPDKVSALVLLGPFVRPANQKWWQRAVFSVALAPPWGKTAWVFYYKKTLYPGPQPDDQAAYVQALSSKFGEKGRMADFRRIAANGHEESGERIDRVTQPVLIVMGTADPEFPDPVIEANDIAEVMSAEVLFAEGSGHYPQADSPGSVAPAIIDMVRRVAPDADV